METVKIYKIEHENDHLIQKFVTFLQYLFKKNEMLPIIFYKWCNN